jgi:NAD(P)-dependent dehydrogenase (short-subunit alcohol dehydrogenase family)
MFCSANPTRRFSRIEELGATCTFPFSAPASYIAAQNILVDGEAYVGAF